MSKNLTKTIQNFSFQADLWRRGSRIIIGVSGGPDSASLLDFWAKMKPKYDLQLIAAHVNYGLRGEDSDRDENFVKKLAEKYGVKFEVLKYSAQEKVNENMLRDIRYAFFEKLRRENDFDLIAVAHNQDDQAETVLIRLMRGAGLKGLSGMKAKNGYIIRPLLSVSRKQILTYLKANKLSFRTDKTNKANLFLRNRIRNQLIPYMEHRFSYNIKKTLAESAVSIGDDAALLDRLAEKCHRQNYATSAKKLLSLDPALQRRVLLLAIQKKKGGLEDIGIAHIQEIIKALKSPKNKHQTVKFQGLKLTRKGDKVTLS